MFLLQLSPSRVSGHQRSFTVMELIIVMAIFSIVLGVIIQIFIFTTAHQQRSRAIQQAQNEARTVLETVAREIQHGQIDYSWYYDPETQTNDLLQQPISYLALRDSDGEMVRFRCVDAEDLPCGSSEQLTMGMMQMCRGTGCSSNSGWSNLVNEELNVVNWQLWVGPNRDPFERDPDNLISYITNEQPWVTMIITIRPRQVSRTPIPDVNLQTTISTRTYFR